MSETAMARRRLWLLCWVLLRGAAAARCVLREGQKPRWWLCVLCRELRRALASEGRANRRSAKRSGTSRTTHFVWLMALLVRVDLLLLLVPGSGPLGHRAGCALGGRWGRLAGAVANARCGH